MVNYRSIQWNGVSRVRTFHHQRKQCAFRLPLCVTRLLVQVIIRARVCPLSNFRFAQPLRERRHHPREREFFFKDGRGRYDPQFRMLVRAPCVRRDGLSPGQASGRVALLPNNRLALRLVHDVSRVRNLYLLLLGHLFLRVRRYLFQLFCLRVRLDWLRTNQLP